MSKFDQFIKHRLKVKYYVRYADDFVLFSRDRGSLEAQIPKIARFLRDELKLDLHPQKVFIRTLASGVDFLGWVHFSDHRVLRTTTKKRMFKKVASSQTPETLQSYLGLLSFGNAHKLRRALVQELG